jgi:hypothetical protein
VQIGGVQRFDQRAADQPAGMPSGLHGA